MRTLRKILLLWGTALFVIAAGAIAHSETGALPTTILLILATSALLGTVSYSLFRRENRKETKLVFLNCAIFFGSNALLIGIYRLIKNWFFASNAWMDFYFCQYNIELYFLLLSFSVIYLVVDHIVNTSLVYVKYFTTLVFVVGVWAALFYPFLLDARYLNGLPDMRNFTTVRESISRLHMTGNANPSTEEIASSTDISLSTGIDLKDEGSAKQKATYIAELMQYMNGDDWVLLLYRPLWRSLAGFGLFSVISILFYVAHQYLRDSPRGAYMEKVVWCFLLYCGFETLHYYAYTKVTNWNVFEGVVNVGAFLSMAVMWLLLLLFGLRLRFIQTVEGNYYERRLLSDPSRITRWRDAFDNWVLKHFMNPGDLDRRFLTQRRTQE